MMKSTRVLSVQSHVVSGYCGNKSATFPLQLLEFEVDVVNTVQLSNHTQYKVASGQIFGKEDLEKVHDGLRANDLIQHYDYVLSGYVANVDYLESLASLVKDIKNKRQELKQDCLYTLDPVLGDDDVGYYVPDGSTIAATYKKHLLPLADIITPNRFEASILSGIDIDTSSDNALSQALQAIDEFHNLGVKLVIITSFMIPKNINELNCIASYKLPSNSSSSESHTNSQERWIIRLPKLECAFTGTGDLFAALMTGWLHKTSFNIKESLEKTANTIHYILEDTLSWYERTELKTVHDYELRLIQNRNHIICPNIRFEATKLETNRLS